MVRYSRLPPNQSAEKKVKLLIINGAECEPYITCDDRLMRDYTDEMIEGIRILRYILRPESGDCG